ncbi:hypothetical protein BDR26DRAFT_873693, partial [Obelidium mucronatum]
HTTNANSTLRHPLPQRPASISTTTSATQYFISPPSSSHPKRRHSNTPTYSQSYNNSHSLVHTKRNSFNSTLLATSLPMSMIPTTTSPHRRSVSNGNGHTNTRAIMNRNMNSHAFKVWLDSVSYKPKPRPATTPSPTPTPLSSPTKPLVFENHRPPSSRYSSDTREFASTGSVAPHPPYFTPTPPTPLLDLGRDQLRALMLESGMHTVAPVTREQLKNGGSLAATPDLYFDEDSLMLEDLALDQGYEPYDILEGCSSSSDGDGDDGFDDSGDESVEKRLVVEEEEEDEDIFEIDAEINDALKELGI